MILRGISTEEAVNLLMKVETENQVFVKAKHSDDYRRAKDYKYSFGYGSGYIDVRKAEFYLEEEDE